MTTSEEVKKKRKFPTLFLLIVISLLTGGIFGLFWNSNDAGLIEELANGYFNAIKSKEYTKAYYAYTSEDFQKETSLDAFKKGVKGYTLFDDAVGLIFNKREVDENQGFFQGVVKSVHGVQAPISFWFVKQDDGWKLEGMESEEAVESVVKQQLLDEIKSPVIDQLDAIRKGHIEKAYQDYASLEFKRATDFAKFSAFIAAFDVIGKSKEEEFLEVHSSGPQATLDLYVHAGIHKLRLVYELIKQQGKWLIFSFQVVPSNETFSINEQDLNEIESVVKNNIQLIKEGQIEAAYNRASFGFKAGTPLAVFKTFIETRPFFNDHDELKIKRWVDINIGKAIAEVISKNGTDLLDFTLFKEEGQWKLWGIEIASAYEQKADEQNAAVAFAAHVKEGQLKEAYDQSMAEGFKKTTSFEAFKKYMETEGFFVLKNQSAKIIDVIDQGDAAVVQMEFLLDDGNSEVLEFDMIKEGLEWKIVGIKIMENAETDVLEDRLSVHFFTKTGGLQAAAKIPQNLKQITAFLFIKQGKPGERVHARLTHRESGKMFLSKILIVDKEGAGSIPLVIQAPEHGFATGKYDLTLSLKGNKYSYGIEVIAEK